MNTVLYYQNLANLVVCSCVSLNLYYYYYVDTSYLNYSIPIIFLHFCIDFFFCKMDIKIHHLLGIIIILYNYINNVSLLDSSIITLTIYKTEISTFFYVFRYFKKEIPEFMLSFPYKNIMSNPLTNIMINGIFLLNDILFIQTFFYYRIYEYYKLITNINMYTNIEKYNYPFIAYFAVNSFFVLNTYWFLILCKIIIKHIIQKYPNLNSYTLCHQITSYTLFLNIFIAGYVYSLSQKEENILDMAGILVLSCSSHTYHNKLYLLLKNNETEYNDKINYTSSDILIPYLNDIAAIHLRSFLCVATSYYTTNKYIITISAYNHAFFYVLYICYIYYLLRNNKQIFLYTSNLEKKIQNKESDMYFKINEICSGIPVCIDVLLCIYNSYWLYSSINVLHTTIIIGFIFYVKPFYNINHVLFHVVLLFQTYFLALCNERK